MIEALEPGSAAAPQPPAESEAGASQPTFEALFLPLVDSAFRFAKTLTRNPSEAEDLVQEAALAAYRSFASFTPGTNFKAWLYRILVNRHYYKHRQQRSRPATVELEDTPELYLYARTAELGLHASCDDPAALLLRKLTSEQVRQAVSGLPREFSVVVSLFFLEELPYDAIATVLECPVGTVRSRLHRGRRMLQKALWEIAREAGIVSQLTTAEASP